MQKTQTLDLGSGDRLPLAEKAYAALERMIVMLELEPGATVTENMVIEESGFGRTPVREALQRLAWEGLVSIRPRSGITIAPLVASDWRKVIEARTGPELLLVRGAARNNSLAEARFRDAAIAMQKAVISGSVMTFLKAGKAFDVALASVGGNPFAARALVPLQVHSRRFWFRFQADEGLAEAADGHVALIRAMTEDGEEQAMEKARDLLALLMAHARRAAES